MGVVAAPAESPPTHVRTTRGMCGTTPGHPDHGRFPDPILLADAHGALALASRDRPSRSFRSGPARVAARSVRAEVRHPSDTASVPGAMIAFTNPIFLGADL